MNNEYTNAEVLSAVDKVADVIEEVGLELWRLAEISLGLGQVKTLILPYPIDAEKFDVLMVDAIVNGADTEFVYGPAADRLNEFGGIGARLYYSTRSAG